MLVPGMTMADKHGEEVRSHIVGAILYIIYIQITRGLNSLSTYFVPKLAKTVKEVSAEGC